METDKQKRPRVPSLVETPDNTSVNMKESGNSVNMSGIKTDSRATKGMPRRSQPTKQAANVQLTLFDTDSYSIKGLTQRSRPAKHTSVSSPLYYLDALAKVYPSVFSYGWNISNGKKVKGRKLGGAVLKGRIRKLARSAGIPVIEIPKNTLSRIAVVGDAIFIYG